MALIPCGENRKREKTGRKARKKSNIFTKRTPEKCALCIILTSKPVFILII